MKINCDKASRKARWLRYAAIAMMAVVAATDVALSWLGMGKHELAWISLHAETPTALAGHSKLALLDALVISLFFLYALYRLVRLMRRFEQGDFYSLSTTRHLRAFACALLLGTLAGCALPAVEIAIARLAGLSNAHAVSIDLDASDVWMLLISTVFFVIAWILGEARQLAEDNQLIV
ncbi:DUF2975 domain-containing protein [Dyella choica]|uniref:DUF2975 domain-containing protein n=1 Tax=Dyella choica TaxID=1927959 RepID=A0A3S0S006_9GAMM|nr:DUF2975 domain-containing protein [Dyella choica]RUL74940.1 DUF2975 domain-containing protein [Dyella choica]